jgi:uncharacterized integral membrane protein (TIGR00698 family)
MRPVAVSSGDPYKNPELFRWLGSMEGVPEWADPAETHQERASRAAWQRHAHRFFELAGTTLPGLTLAALLATAGTLLADWVGVTLMGFETTPVTPILLAILLGLAIRNTVGLPSVYEAGLQLALKRVLRLGVALLGLRLSVATVGSIGLLAVPIVVVCVGAALLFSSWIGRGLGLPARLGTLIAVGTAICGNSAIVATAPLLRARDDEVSYAVGCVTVFGLIGLLGYPYLAHAVFGGDPQLAGLFLGTAIHDTAQVAGAGLVYLQHFGTGAALDTATVTKLVRNAFMLAVIPLVAWRYQRGESGSGGRIRFSQAVPLFVLAFVGLSLLRTLGDLMAPEGTLLSPERWKLALGLSGEIATACLIVAMAAVGLGTSLTRLRGLGLRPLGAGLAVAALVGVVSYLAIVLGLPRLRFWSA